MLDSGKKKKGKIHKKCWAPSHNKFKLGELCHQISKFFVGTKEKHYFDHSHSAEFQAGSSSSLSSFISLFVTANFTGYSRLLGEETSRNHQAFIGRPLRHHNIIRNKGGEEVRL